MPINEALKTASKQQTGKAGFPEYTAVVGDFVLVMEDKADRANLCLKEEDGTISMTVQATTDYAVNGAFHYAQHILQKTAYKKVFAFGNGTPDYDYMEKYVRQQIAALKLKYLQDKMTVAV